MPRRSLAVIPARVRRHAEDPFDLLLRLPDAHAARLASVRSDRLGDALVLEAHTGAAAKLHNARLCWFLTRRHIHPAFFDRCAEHTPYVFLRLAVGKLRKPRFGVAG